MRTYTTLLGLALASASALATASALGSEPALAGDPWSSLQDWRESGDPAHLDAAGTMFTERLTTEDHADALVGLGSFALARHDFDGALAMGRRAQDAAPRSSRPLGVTFDALMELGRYDEAGATVERMVRTRPDLPSLSRLSYYHQRHGRVDLAIDAMERAVVAGAAEAEHVEFARTLLGELWLLEGDVDRARRLFETSLEAIPDYAPARLGLTRAELALGDAVAAEALLRASIATDLEPATMLFLGELLLTVGRDTEADEMLEAARLGEQRHRDGGEPPEPFGVVMEADHGSSTLALRLAREAYAHAPSIDAADALAWASFTSGRLDDAWRHAQEAVRTDSPDPGIRFHAGAIALAVGQADQARIHLDAAWRGRAAGSPLLATRISEARSTLAHGC